jgi:phage shock protein PspC (stress-responsive transcriptional regulator)
MTSSQHTRTAGYPAPEPGSSWSGRFRRSGRDRKIAGVAGGIGRALGVDPVLIRVAFVVLTIFGGSGIALYALGWLLMPGERDQVSAVEALLGRGQSSVPAPLAVVLGIVVLGSVTSTFTFGLPLLPIAITAAVVFAIVGKRRHRSGGCHGGDRFNRQMQDFADRAGQWGDDFGRRAGKWGDEVGRKAERWGMDLGHRAEHWGSHLGHRVGGRRSDPDRSSMGFGSGPDSRSGSRPGSPGSPFERPAFWDDDSRYGAPDPGSRQGGSEPVDLRKGRAEGQVDPPQQDAADVGPTVTTPPAWDPLGAAPFAWDLPEPGPAPASLQEAARNRRNTAMARATVGVAFIVAAVLALGLSVGWWQLNWAVISASALAVVAVGLFISAVRGRRSKLIGFGIVLAIATGFFTLTGMDGTGGFGERTWQPQSVDQVQSQYRLGAGDATLDLRNVDIPAHQTVTSSIDLHAGDLTVLLPADANASVHCTANFGEVKCLEQQAEGFHQEVRAASTVVTPDQGRFDLDVHAGAGQVTVRNGN